MILLLLVILAVCAPCAAAASVEDLPCVLCHPSRDRSTFERLSADPSVILGSESAQAFVCLSCHDGAVVDSRAILRRGGQHPSGFAAGRRLPAPFPLYGEGRLECGTCHSPHGKGPGAERWLRVADDGTAPCQGCHPSRSERHLEMELGVGQAARLQEAGGRLGAAGHVVCATCHVAHGARGPNLLIEGYGARADDLCRLCHDGLEVKGARAGDPGYQPCADCHLPHGGRNRLLEGGDDGPCRRCHPERAGEGEHAATATCSECHSVHQPVKPGGSPKGALRMPASEGLLCLPCHPESGARHVPGSKVPGADLRLLAERGIAVGPEGRLDCLSCHRAHGARAAPLLSLQGGLLCLYCHPDQNPFGREGAKTGTHPVGVALRGEGPGEGASPGGGVLTCTSCHRAHGEDLARGGGCVDCHPENVAGAGHGGVEGCGACHQIHGREPPGATCAGCHPEQEASVHPGQARAAANPLPTYDAEGRRSGPGRITCPTCHEPHAEGGRGLRMGSPAETCEACHEDKARIEGGPHDGARVAGERLSGSSCSPCHPAHGTEGPSGNDPAAARCRGCHGEDLRVIPAHTPAGPPPWAGLEGKLPLFDRFGARNPYGFISCPTCHDVHQGAGRGALRLEAGDPPELCLSCHREKETLLGSSHDPRASGGGDACGACHPPHGRGDSAPPFWELRETGQGSWNDRKCSPCHRSAERGLSAHTGPASHPVNRNLPSGLKAEGLPLYDSLGGRPGRQVVCLTCHNLHGARREGGARLPHFLRMTTDAGELCLACHPEEGAVVQTAHDLRSGGPSALGPCGPCHTAHRARTERSLWGLAPAEGAYLPNRLCRSCHRQGGAVQSDYVLLQYHMKDAETFRTPRGTIYLQRPMLLLDELALRTGETPVLPLYDPEGEAGPEGNLQCVSCHEPHQWSPLGDFVKPGFGALGPNVPTRFLRLRNPAEAGRSVCATCHPKDAVERYLKYHYVWEDVGGEFH